MRAMPSLTSSTSPTCSAPQGLVVPLDLAEQHVLDLARAKLGVDRHVVLFLFRSGAEPEWAFELPSNSAGSGR